MTRTFAWTTLVFAAVASAGCAGYSTRPLYDTSIRTVAVPIFANRSFEREVEFQLTEAVKKRIGSQTPYAIAGSARADTVLTGTITSINRSSISRDFDSGVTQENRVVINVSLEWKDLRDGRILRDRRDIQGSGRYQPARAIGTPSEVAFHAAIDDLSRQIAVLMRSDW